jgi:lincosamide nucleotidyltransferase B/F
MEHAQRLLTRLDAIGASLAHTEGALALLGLGSVGRETARIDAYSDLDFFVIVAHGFKHRFLNSLAWLAQPSPLAFQFMNTPDGYKALYADGIFCEFAVFEPHELAHVSFAPGRVVWSRDDFDRATLSPPPRTHTTSDTDWLLNEALTNLYVGLGRDHRGEILSAARFIQGDAVDRLVELTPVWETAQDVFPDIFGGERRYEQRFPNTAAHLPSFMQGYAHNRASARALLDFLAARLPINAALHAAILHLCEPTAS